VVAAQAASQIVSLIVLAGLLRLVAQADFGLMGMVMPLVLLLRTFASAGLSVAAVQRDELSLGQASSLFWLHVALGGLVAAALIACSPLLALAYRAPDVAVVCTALAGTPVVAALGAQHQALLERRLRLGRLAVTRLAAQTLGGAAGLSAAWAGWGVWALVIQQYVELLVLAAALWVAEPFRPSLPTRYASIFPILSFSGWYTLSGLTFAAAHNLDKILLAVFLGSTRTGQAALGMYAQAYNLMIKPVYLVSTPLTGVMLPALSRARRDPPTYRDLLSRFYRLAAIALMPCGFGLFLVAEDMMVVLGGPEWRSAGTMLRALSPAILVLGSINITGSVFSSAGRADRLATAAVATTLFLAGGLSVGLFMGRAFGTGELGPAQGVAWGYSLTWVLIVFPPYVWYAGRTIEQDPAIFVAPQRRAFLAAAGMAAIVGGLGFGLSRVETIPLIRLVVMVAAGVALYAVLARRELRYVREQLFEFRPNVR
jgi:PST family polysaccharide transporter